MFFRAYNQIIESDFDLNLPQVEKQMSDIIFKKGSLSLNANITTRIYRRGIAAKGSINEEKTGLHWEDIADFEAENGNLLTYQPITDQDGLFRLFILSEALGLILFQKGFFLLHGSCVKIGDKAVVFLGLPGAGKSTTAAAYAKNGFPILSDDMVALTFDLAGNPMVLPAFPEIKIWEDAVIKLGIDPESLKPAFEGHNKFIFQQKIDTFPTEPIPLKKIVILQKPYAKKRPKLKLATMTMELIKYFPLYKELLKDGFLTTHFHQSLQVVTRVEIKHINRPKNINSLQKLIASNTI